MNKPTQIILLAIATIAAVGLWWPSAYNAAGWVRPLLPLILAGGMGYHAHSAHTRGDHQTAAALLGWATVATGVVAILAALSRY